MTYRELDETIQLTPMATEAFTESRITDQAGTGTHAYPSRRATPAVAVILHNLAGAYRAINRRDEAELLLKRALQIWLNSAVSPT